MKTVSFKSNNLKIAGNLFLPKNFGENAQKFPAIVVAHPGGAVKEQASGAYAEKLAKNGFAALAYDAAYHGESEGTPRGFENPEQRVEDIRSAAAFLATMEGIDPQKIGALGICASGGYTLVATATDHNIKVLATVSGVDLGDWNRKGPDGNQDPAIIQQLLDAAAADRIAVANGAEPGKFSIRFDEETAKMLGGINYEGYEYYSTDRAQHPNQTNEFTWSSMERIAGFYSVPSANLISPRPFLAIAGSKAQTLWMTKEAVDSAKEPKELFIIDGATHISLYDDLSESVPKLVDFFRKSLG